MTISCDKTGEYIAANAPSPLGLLLVNRLAFARYIVLRFGVGTLLLYAGLSKITAGQPVLLLATWVAPSSAVLAWGIFECALGLLTIRFSASQRLNRVLIAVFSVFLVSLLIDWSQGADRCNCLGGGGLPVVNMILMDVVIILGLFLDRRLWRTPLALPPGLLRDITKRACLVVPATLLLSVYFFGSPSAAVSYVAGASVTVSSPQKFAGVIAPEQTATAVFRVRNATNKPVRIYGARGSCRGVTTDDLPLTLAPRETRAIRIHLVANQAEGIQLEIAELLFDDFSLNARLGVMALVRRNP